MEELQVPTRRVAVTIHATGATIDGDLFITAGPTLAGHPEDVIDVLNDDRGFLPFSPRDADEDPSAVNKQHIRRVHVAHPSDEGDGDPLDRGAVHEPFPCTLVLDDGSTLSGGLLIDSPLTAARLLDKINMATRFVPFVTEVGLDLVNTSRIVRAF